MAGGNVQPGTGAPEQTPQTYGAQMPPAYGQPYQQPRVPTDFADLMRKTFLIILIGVGALLMFIGRLVAIFGGFDNRNVASGLSAFGVFVIAVPAVIWGLGSKRMTDMQKLGVILLAAFLLVAMVV